MKLHNIAFAATLALASPAYAQHHHGGGHGGGGNNWIAPFVGGAILGGILGGAYAYPYAYPYPSYQYYAPQPYANGYWACCDYYGRQYWVWR